MVAIKLNDRIQAAGFIQAPQLNRVGEREVTLCGQMVTDDVIGVTRRECKGANARPPVSERELRIHAWLIERLMLLQDEKLKQRNLWHKTRGFLLDNCLGRWLGFQPTRI